MRLKSILFFALGASLAAIMLWTFWEGDTIKPDENLVFFPTSAHKQADSSWLVPIHSWIFEKEDGHLSRRAARKLIGEIAEHAGASKAETHSQIFKDRIQYFLVDNERGKTLNITLSSLMSAKPELRSLGKSQPNGHSTSLLSYHGDAPDGSWLTYAPQLNKNDRRSFLGQTKLVPPDGVSVICDIDDTIKISEVLDKKKLIRNTLLLPFKPVTDMSKYLWELEKKGSYFHYVSAAPWQLYPSLKPFMDNHVPRGTISLRPFRLQDGSILSFLGSSQDYKINAISKIIQRYPDHQFILIGDSGEKDPEIYGHIARTFPGNIKKIIIRNVAGSDTGANRFASAFQNISAALWSLKAFD